MKTIQGVTMSTRAARVVTDCGIDVVIDVIRVKKGFPPYKLLDECLTAVGTIDKDAWRDYVDAVAARVSQLKATK